jgi:dienelactone hydrolase
VVVPKGVKSSVAKGGSDDYDAYDDDDEEEEEEGEEEEEEEEEGYYEETYEQEEDVEADDDVPLGAWFNAPSMRGVVVTVADEGQAGPSGLFKQMATNFPPLGISVLLLKVVFGQEIRTLVRAVSWLRKEYQSLTNIVLVGFSRGVGTILHTMRHLSQNDLRGLRGVVLIAPSTQFGNTPKNARRGQRGRGRAFPPGPQLSPMDFQKLKGKHVYVVHGQRDIVAKPKLSILLWKQIKQAGAVVDLEMVPQNPIGGSDRLHWHRFQGEAKSFLCGMLGKPCSALLCLAPRCSSWLQFTSHTKTWPVLLCCR